MNGVDVETKALALLTLDVQAGFRVDPVLVAKGLGIEVHLAEFYDESIRGLLVRRDGKKSIAVKAGADPLAQRFVIAHLGGACRPAFARGAGGGHPRTRTRTSTF